MENESIKKDMNILWLKNEKNKIVDFAKITEIKGKVINIEWYDGAELKTEKIKEESVLAIEDKAHGLEIELGGYTGKGRLTHHGYEFAGKYEKKDKQTNITKKSS